MHCQTTDKSYKCILYEGFVTAIIYKEETMEYQWIMTFLVSQ